MAEFDMLASVKNALNITGNYQNNTIQFYINEVNAFLIDAGVSSSLINTQASAGVVARGVADLWNYGSGDGKLSTYFMQRAIQLSINKNVQLSINK